MDHNFSYNVNNSFRTNLDAPSRSGSPVFYQSQHAMAFPDNKPIAAQHDLVIPRAPYSSMAHLALEGTAAEIGQYCKAVLDVIKQHQVTDTAIQLVSNHGNQGNPRIAYGHKGNYAHQTVFHLHTHVVSGQINNNNNQSGHQTIKITNHSSPHINSNIYVLNAKNLIAVQDYLVIPQQPYSSVIDFYENASIEEIGKFWQSVMHFASKQGFLQTGFRVAINYQPTAENSENRFYIHILSGQNLGGTISTVRALRSLPPITFEIASESAMVNPKPTTQSAIPQPSVEPPQSKTSDRQNAAVSQPFFWESIAFATTFIGVLATDITANYNMSATIASWMATSIKTSAALAVSCGLALAFAVTTTIVVGIALSYCHEDTQPLEAKTSRYELAL